MFSIKFAKPAIKPPKDVFFEKFRTVEFKDSKNSALATSLYIGLGAPLHAMKCYASRVPIYGIDYSTRHNRDSIIENQHNHELFRDLFSELGSKFAREPKINQKFFKNPEHMLVAHDTRMIINMIKNNYSASIGGLLASIELRDDWSDEFRRSLIYHDFKLSSHCYFNYSRYDLEKLEQICLNSQISLNHPLPWDRTTGELKANMDFHHEQMKKIWELIWVSLSSRIDSDELVKKENYDGWIRVNGIFD
jgi:hypothetical protein